MRKTLAASLCTLLLAACGENSPTDKIKQAAGDVAQTAKDGVNSTIESTKDAAKDAVNKSVDAAKGKIGDATNSVKDTINNVVPGSTPTAPDVTTPEAPAMEMPDVKAPEMPNMELMQEDLEPVDGKDLGLPSIGDAIKEIEKNAEEAAKSGMEDAGSAVQEQINDLDESMGGGM